MKNSEKYLFRGQVRRKGEKVVNFRGDLCESEWVYGGLFAGDGDYSIIYSYEHLEKHTVYSDTIGQYTGRDDTSGKKIFEGDIVRGCCLLYTVCRKNGCFGLERDGAFISMSDIDTDTMTVVGNIYDSDYRNDKKVVIVINGTGGCGKDTFVKLVSKVAEKSLKGVENTSSIDPIKDAAMHLGWKGAKDDASRKFLSDMKKLSEQYNDYPFLYMQERYKYFMSGKESILFLHIREPENIKKAVEAFGAKTLLVTRAGVEVNSNESDANVLNYKYDYVVENNSSIEDLEAAAERFFSKVMSDD